MENKSATDRGLKFMRDLKIYAIGNLGSKLVTFILVPFYTFFITDPAQFGYYDICLIVTFCISSALSLQLSQGAFRFLLETTDSGKKCSLVSYTLLSIARNSLILILIGTVVFFFCNIRFMVYVVAYSIIFATYDSVIQLVRGLGYTTVYTSTNIFNSLAIALMSIVTVALLGLGIEGIFIANIFARVLSLVWIQLRTHLFSKYLSLKPISSQVKRELLRYSVPLLPIMISWWVLDSSNAFFINIFLGLTENGIYAILAKFTSIQFVLANIFYQTWQQNAIEQYNSPDRDKFFSSVFNNYVYLLCILVATFPLVVRINFCWLVSEEYQSAAQYMFANSLVIIGFALSAFLELGYQCAKHTGSMIPSVIGAALISITLNWLLTPKLGIYGIITASTVTYFFLFIYRAIDTRRFMTIKAAKFLWRPIGILALSGVVFYTSTSMMVDIIALIVIITLSVMALPYELSEKLKKFIPFK